MNIKGVLKKATNQNKTRRVLIAKNYRLGFGIEKNYSIIVFG